MHSPPTDDLRTESSPAHPQGGSTAAEAVGSPAAPRPTGTSFSVQRVLLGVLLLAAVGGAGAGAWWYFMVKEPPIYPVHGVAYLDGEPMTEGVVMTYYAGRPELLGGMAGIGKDGRFEFTTNDKSGLYAGEHKIMVSLMSGGFPPVTLIPEKYASPAHTPFSVVVDEETQKTPLKLELIGRKEPPGSLGSAAEPADSKPGGPASASDADVEPGAPRL